MAIFCFLPALLVVGAGAGGWTWVSHRYSTPWADLEASRDTLMLPDSYAPVPGSTYRVGERNCIGGPGCDPGSARVSSGYAPIDSRHRLACDQARRLVARQLGPTSLDPQPHGCRIQTRQHVGGYYVTVWIEGSGDQLTVQAAMRRS